MSIFSDELESLTASGLYRSMPLVEGGQSGHITLDGKKVLLLCSNNYLGLADHPLLKAAAIEAIEKFGVGSGASRLVSGNMLLHQLLEKRLAEFKNCEAAILFNGGYPANLGIIAALIGRDDTIYSDRLNHASIVDGAILSRGRFVRYPHCDCKALRRLLEQHQGKGRQLIITDGVFSMDGDMAPLQELVALKKEFGALIMVDDAHGTGVLGETGRGSAELCAVSGDIDIQMGTLGKGVGSFGAYVTGSSELIDYLRNKARSFIFSTSLPPSVLAASIAAIDLIDSREGKLLRKQLSMNSALFAGALKSGGFDTLASVTQIIPILVGKAEQTMEFSRQLLEKNIFVQGIRPPTVPPESCRLRCTVMATHDPLELEQAAETIITIGRRLGIV